MQSSSSLVYKSAIAKVNMFVYLLSLNYIKFGFDYMTPVSDV